MITSRCIERIKNSVDIYDVVMPYVSLKKCGVNWRGLSPFNHEKTPSFFVMPSKKIFRCFSSGNAGDIFRFIQLKENVSFKDAVEMIAQRFNIPLEFEKFENFEKKSYSKRDLFEIQNLACSFFVKNFHQNTDVANKIRRYWTEKRQFSIETAKKYEIGFADNNSRNLIKLILEKKFSVDAIKASGLFFFNDNETDPLKFGMRFHSRLTIPIRDIQGRIVGFSARVVDEISSTPFDLSDAKYINSPETDIFHKGQILFGLDQARQYVDSDNVFWLVEGQFDALRCWDNGINTAIAPQGTAITDTQLSILRRYTTNLHCLLDGDPAGLKAAERMIPMAIIAGLDVKIFIIPDGNDPDTYFQKDFSNRIQRLQNSGMSMMEFIVFRSLNSPMSAAEKASALSKIYEVIAIAESSVVQESYLHELATISKIDKHAIFQDYQSFLGKRKFLNTPVTRKPIISVASQADNNSRQDYQTSHKLSSAESQLLSIALTDKSIAQGISEFIDQEFLRGLQSQEGKILIKVLNELKELMWEGISTLDNSEIFSDSDKNIAYAVIAELDDECDRLAIANTCLKRLHSNFIKRKIESVDNEIRNFSLDEDITIRNLQKTRMKLREMLNRPPQIL